VQQNYVTVTLCVLPCDLSLITIHISDWRHFSDIYISQGSVATCLRRGGMSKQEFVANLLLSLAVKKLENWLILGEVMDKNGVLFLDSQCRVSQKFCTRNFFRTAVVCSDPCKITKFYSVISNFYKIMLYQAPSANEFFIFDKKICHISATVWQISANFYDAQHVSEVHSC